MYIILLINNKVFSFLSFCSEICHIKMYVIFINKLITSFLFLAFVVKKENSKDLVYNDYSTLEEDFKNLVIFLLLVSSYFDAK